MKKYFEKIAAYSVAQPQGEEVILVNFSAEETDFSRFNNAAIRQAGHVEQAGIELTLIANKRQASISLRLQLHLDVDQNSVDENLQLLRQRLEVLPEDEFILYSKGVHNSENLKTCELDAQAMVKDVLAQSEDLDFVGILASGHIYRGFANSLGQTNFFACSNFNLDFSLYYAADKAVKGGISGAEWDTKALSVELQRCQSELELMKKEAITLDPGEYDVFLSPTALGEFLDMLCWGGFSGRAHATKGSALHRLGSSDLNLSKIVSLQENTAAGYAASFQEQGFLKPDLLALVEKGEYKNSLVSPRSSLEYKLEANGADESERGYAYQMQGGELDFADAAKELGTGIYINNLWYLNYSDRNNCRITGMTRFCCYFVKDGVPVAPVNVLRFDDSLYDLLGDKLEALTKERQLLMEAGTYYERSSASMLLPGALIRGMKFTL